MTFEELEHFPEEEHSFRDKQVTETLNNPKQPVNDSTSIPNIDTSLVTEDGGQDIELKLQSGNTPTYNHVDKIPETEDNILSNTDDTLSKNVDIDSQEHQESVNNSELEEKEVIEKKQFIKDDADSLYQDTTQLEEKTSLSNYDNFLQDESFAFTLLDDVESKKEYHLSEVEVDDDNDDTADNIFDKLFETEPEKPKVFQLNLEERQNYYTRYDELDAQLAEQKTKNDYLLKKLVHYYQKRKMFHVLQEGKTKLDVIKKYEKQLEGYELLGETSILEQAQLEKNTKSLQETCMKKEIATQEAFKKLQEIEYDSVKDIIFSKTAKGFEEKIVDRYLKRQKIQLNNLREIRLEFIKIRNKTNETQTALDAIDNLGPDFRLIDYEQLKHDNRNLNDKLEEKDLELTEIRKRCQNTMQILAHIREKIAALNVDIKELDSILYNATAEAEEIREHLNIIKQERDLYRKNAERLRNESGLLMKPKLLNDMFETCKEGETLQHITETLKKDCYSINDKLKKIRDNIKSSSNINKIKIKMLQESDPSLPIRKFSTYE